MFFFFFGCCSQFYEWCIPSKLSAWEEQCDVRGLWEREERRETWETEGGRNRETPTWSPRLLLSRRQLGLWKSGEACCESIFCRRNTLLLFSFSLLFLTTKPNACSFGPTLRWTTAQALVRFPIFLHFVREHCMFSSWGRTLYWPCFCKTFKRIQSEPEVNQASWLVQRRLMERCCHKAIKELLYGWLQGNWRHGGEKKQKQNIKKNQTSQTS